MLDTPPPPLNDFFSGFSFFFFLGKLNFKSWNLLYLRTLYENINKK